MTKIVSNDVVYSNTFYPNSIWASNFLWKQRPSNFTKWTLICDVVVSVSGDYFFL